MKYLIICGVIWLILMALVLLFYHIKSLKPVRSVILHALISLTVLTILNLVSKYTGIKIPINAYTVSAIGIIGIPAICGFLILNLML